MKKYLITILLFLTTLNCWCNIQLPWDSLFNAYGLSKSMAEIPTLISPKLDIRYNNGNCAGLWGLTPPIARRYGLTITNNIDERYDIKLATEAAAKYLKDLLAHYGNEQIAILAYINGAPLMVEMATICKIDLMNATDEDMNILLSSLEIKVHDKNDEEQSIENEDLRLLYNHTGYTKQTFNHPIRIATLRDSVFADSSMFYIQNSAILPSTRWISEAYIPNDITIAQLTRICDAEKEALLTELAEAEKQKAAEEKARIEAIKKANAVKIYYVKSGDTLEHIAKRHHVSVRQIKQWNNLKSDMIRIGQKLKIHTN